MYSTGDEATREPVVASTKKPYCCPGASHGDLTVLGTVYFVNVARVALSGIWTTEKMTESLGWSGYVPLTASCT